MPRIDVVPLPLSAHAFSTSRTAAIAGATIAALLGSVFVSSAAVAESPPPSVSGQHPVVPIVKTYDLTTVAPSGLRQDGVLDSGATAQAGGSATQGSTPAPTPTTEDGDGLAALTPSLPVKAAGPMVVGASWQGNASGRVELRTLKDGVWGEWQALDEEDAADGAEGAHRRAGTEPFVVTDASDVQVRLLGRTAPADAKVFVVDPGASAADQAAVAANPPLPAGYLPAPPAADTGSGAVGSSVALANVPAEPTTNARDAAATAASGVPEPAIGSRASWGADESLRKGPVLYGTVKAAVVHHTAGSNSYTAAEVPAILRGIYAFHVNGRGWNDIGYNILADKFGRLWEGRYGGLDKAVVGAQVSGYNSVTFGISMLGTFDTAAPPAVAVTAVEKAIAWKLGLAGVLAGTNTTLNGKTYPTIVGHRDLGSTDCPGAAYYAKLPSMRTAVRKVQDAAGPDPEARKQVAAKFSGLGGAGYFGAASGGLVAQAGGWVQAYKNGTIYYTAATGAHAVVQGIRTHYVALGAAAGDLGFPTTDEKKTPDGTGAYNNFEHGSIHWTAETSAQSTRGAIQNAWGDDGWENSDIRYPVIDEKCGLVDHGCYQTFQHGSIHWSSASGARITKGGIRTAWADSGWQDGDLGYPIVNEKCGLKDAGCYQTFQHGSIHWTAATHAWVTKGAIQNAWAGSGWENGRLGYPTGNEKCNAAHNACTQTYQGGRIEWMLGRPVVIAVT